MDDDENVLWFCCHCGTGGMTVKGQPSCPECYRVQCGNCRSEYGNPSGEKPKRPMSPEKVNNQQQKTRSTYFTAESPTALDPDNCGPFLTPSPEHTGIGSVHIDSSSFCPGNLVRGNTSSFCEELGNSSTTALPRSKIDLPISSDTYQRSVSPQKKIQLKEKRVRKRKQSTIEPEKKPSEKFACLFYKQCPQKYNSRMSLKYRACSGPGFAEIRHLKEHLENSHKKEDINVAAQWNKIEELLKTRLKRRKKPSEVWSEWWKTLFPTEIEPRVPYYDDVEGIPQVSSLDLDDLLETFETFLQIHYLEADLEFDETTIASKCAVRACRDMLTIALNDQVNKSGVKAFQTNMPVPQIVENFTNTKDIEATASYYQEPSLTVCTDPMPCTEYVAAATAESTPKPFRQDSYLAPDFENRYHTVAGVPRNYYSANIETNQGSYELPTYNSIRYSFPHAQMPYNTFFQLDGTQTQYQSINEQDIMFDNDSVPREASTTEIQIHPIESYDPLFRGPEVSSSTSYDGYSVPILPYTGVEVQNVPFNEAIEWNENNDHNFFVDRP